MIRLQRILVLGFYITELLKSLSVVFVLNLINSYLLFTNSHKDSAFRDQLQASFTDWTMNLQPLRPQESLCTMLGYAWCLSQTKVEHSSRKQTADSASASALWSKMDLGRIAALWANTTVTIIVTWHWQDKTQKLEERVYGLWATHRTGLMRHDAISRKPSVWASKIPNFSGPSLFKRLARTDLTDDPNYSI